MGWLTTQVENHGSAFENMLIESMHEAASMMLCSHCAERLAFAGL